MIDGYLSHTMYYSHKVGKRGAHVRPLQSINSPSPPSTSLNGSGNPQQLELRTQELPSGPPLTLWLHLVILSLSFELSPHSWSL